MPADIQDESGNIPKYIFPIIPMVLVNGISGIGTGFSTNIPKFSPAELQQIILQLLQNKTPNFEILPFYKYHNRNFKVTKKNICSWEHTPDFEIDNKKNILYLK
jgi:DNA gyrase/topoisomerase IV subunit A